SIYAHWWGVPFTGGWTVADVQRFWLSLGVWGAVNSDGGDLAQLLVRTPTGYDLSPPCWSSRDMRQTYSYARLGDAPQGGSLMYFYVRDTGAKQ
ncbi:MAG: hypothetical protein H7Y38_00935, partial [Armatimonadetes bacterium]|nr:hypothetical protein [Armatimonadota bacterium]